jgi:hypothetical protein
MRVGMEVRAGLFEFTMTVDRIRKSSRFYPLHYRLATPRPPLPSSPRTNDREPCGTCVPAPAPGPAPATATAPGLGLGLGLGPACPRALGEERAGLTELRA